MTFSHIALATSDLEATHRFYTEAIGFTLVHVEGAPTDVPPGWLRHAFYDTGDGSLIAFMQLHDERFADIDASISRGLGLPSWVNHGGRKGQETMTMVMSSLVFPPRTALSTGESWVPGR
jgi:catechol 2,3-dioxygenase-like lactoylglutathione lyase family enzyme